MSALNYSSQDRGSPSLKSIALHAHMACTNLSGVSPNASPITARSNALGLSHLYHGTQVVHITKSFVRRNHTDEASHQVVRDTRILSADGRM